jgi:hypothetical protein
MMKTRSALALLAVLLSAAGGHAQAFKDLPGVVRSDATEEYSGRDAVVCEQRVDVPRNSSSRWMPRNVYVCNDNGMTSSSTRLPPNSLRALRGLGY